VPGVSVRLTSPGHKEITARTDEGGRFSFARELVDTLSRDHGARLTLDGADAIAPVELRPRDLWFEPVRCRPLPDHVAGMRACARILDGAWRMTAAPPAEARLSALSAALWKPFRVPGQWLQQGLDVPQEQAVSVAREFSIPQEWSGHAVVLRFDAVHAGTRYRLNGKEIGYSENLFTPVEWDITGVVRFGAVNRLDMEMLVATPSERLAYASGYAFHNLGGIDRSVRVFALPRTHLRSLRIAAGLAADYTTGTLSIAADVEGPDASATELRATVAGHGSLAAHRSRPTGGYCSLSVSIPGVRPWTPETPTLYDLTIELVAGGRALERVTRKIGFRTVEVRGSQLLVNGRPVKLAGACRHETDPLTGRADTARHAAADVRLIKEANLNYIRTAHYPPTQEFLDECDRQGVFVEVEAPFCWVGDEGYGSLREVLTPTSAMVDYHHRHPSVIIWSLANESTFNPCFEVSNRLVKELDPTRPTTFNNPDPKRICDIANVHYPRMPFDDYDKDDPRPLLLGEYFFPVCHEQTDVMRNPGLRELWGAGHSDPDSDYARACGKEFEQPYMQPGEPPGAWTHIVKSRRVIGGAIWAAFDEPFYLPGGKRAGYAWVHGFWGLLDGWRRPKPEHWLARRIFSPVWFPVRRLPFRPGERQIAIPVENRFAFTNLSQVQFRLRCRRHTEALRVEAAPGATATLIATLPAGAKSGDEVVCEAVDASGRSIVVCTMWLGEPRVPPLPNPGPPSASLPEAPGSIGGASDRPALHVTRFDFADLWSEQPPFAVLTEGRPQCTVSRDGSSVVVRQKWATFEGAVTITSGETGLLRIEYDFVNTGRDFYAREIGIRIPFAGHEWRLAWERWSEWGDAPDDTIMRRRGEARPFRGKERSRIPESTKPKWSWALDETAEGTCDFRSVKFNILRASLVGGNGQGLTVFGSADVHVRAAIEGSETAFYLLTRCAIGPKLIRSGERLRGSFVAAPSGLR